MLKISVVEDILEIRNSLVKVINQMENTICISNYPSAELALEHLPKDNPDLVLMDIGLPKMSGVECMVKVNSLNNQIDFLVFTVFEDDENVFDALKAGARGYILKSEGPFGAVKAIQDYQKGGGPMSPNIALKVLMSFNMQKKQNDIASLTKRQEAILKLIADGLLNKEIAARLGITEGTVKQQNNAIFKKLQVNNRVEATKKYLEKK